QAEDEVEGDEGEGGRKADQANDFPAFTFDGGIDGSESRVIAKFLRNPISEEIAAEQEGAAGNEGCTDGGVKGLPDGADEEACAERENDSGKESDAGKNVCDDKTEGCPRAHATDPFEHGTEELARIGGAQERGDGRGQNQKDDQPGEVSFG